MKSFFLAITAVSSALCSATAWSAGLSDTVQKLNQAAQGTGQAKSQCCSVVSGSNAEPVLVMRTPAGNETFPLPTDLLKGVRMFKTGIQTPQFTRTTCTPFLKNIYSNMLRVPPTYFDQQLLNENAPEIVQELFLTRIALRNSLATLENSGPVSPDCINAVRDIMRASNFILEYLVEHFKLAPGHDRVFEGNSSEMLVNPAFASENGMPALQDGDILLSRGDAFVSGAIARIGDTDGTYSHVALIHIDPATGKKYVVEAHIEVGVLVSPLEKYRTDGKSRSTIFRQKDRLLAAKAAKMMYDRATKATASGKNIPYDFAMVLEGKDKKGRPSDIEIFCSEVAYEGYKKASDGRFILPRYSTGLHMKNDAFKKAIGVTADETFAPDDLNVDTRFELVGEWRNFKKTEKSRMTDAILTSAYDAMEKHNYVLEPTRGDKFKRDFAYALRHLPLFSRLFKDKFPANMSRSALGTMLALDKTAAPMLARLKAASDENKKKTGYAFTGPQMIQFLSDLREKDYATYETYQAYKDDESTNGGNEIWTPPQTIPPKPIFHGSFHPKDED